MLMFINEPCAHVAPLTDSGVSQKSYLVPPANSIRSMAGPGLVRNLGLYTHGESKMEGPMGRTRNKKSTPSITEYVCLSPSASMRGQGSNDVRRP